MSVDSSSSSNASLPPSPISSSISIYHQLQNCLNTTVGAFHVTGFTITSILVLLPLCIFVLYLGLQGWRQLRSDQKMNHSDVFTLHMVVTELMSVFGSILISCGIHADLQIMLVGIYLFSINTVGQMLFHMLTSVERYLAVVHPITYLSLKKENGIRLRNVAIVGFWLLDFLGTGLILVENSVPVVILFLCFMAFVLTVVSFCSLSVLYVLIRPGPGEEGRQRVDQSKLRAFYSIMAILGVLSIRFGGNIVTSTLYSTLELLQNEKCGVWLSRFWFCLPSSLVSPLLFLQRAGKLLCCKRTMNQDKDQTRLVYRIQEQKTVSERSERSPQLTQC